MESGVWGLWCSQPIKKHHYLEQFCFSLDQNIVENSWVHHNTIFKKKKKNCIEGILEEHLSQISKSYILHYIFYIWVSSSGTPAVGPQNQISHRNWTSQMDFSTMGPEVNMTTVLTLWCKSFLELNHCIKKVFTVKVIMFSQLIPLRPTCPIIIVCLNEITQWLSSFHWPTKLHDLGTLGGKKEGEAGGTIWHSLWCGLWIIILCKLAKWALLPGVISRHHEGVDWIDTQKYWHDIILLFTCTRFLETVG